MFGETSRLGVRTFHRFRHSHVIGDLGTFSLQISLDWSHPLLVLGIGIRDRRGTQ